MPNDPSTDESVNFILSLSLKPLTTLKPFIIKYSSSSDWLELISHANSNVASSDTLLWAVYVIKYILLLIVIDVDREE